MTEGNRQDHQTRRGACHITGVCRAFTLIELLIVLIIIGVMTGGVVLMFVGNRSLAKVRIAAQDLGTAITFAHGESVEFGTTFRVIFSSDQRRYRVERLPRGWAGANTREDAYVPVSGTAGRWHVIDSEVQIVGMRRRGSMRIETPQMLLFSGEHEGFSGVLEMETGAIQWQVEVSDDGSVSVFESGKNDPH